MLRAGVRAAVELEAKLRDLRAEALLERLDQRAEPRLRLGDGEVAVRLAGARDRVAAQAFLLDRETDPLELEERLLELGLGDSREDEVLLARDADVAAEPLGIIWSPEMSPRCTGTPIETVPFCFCGWTPR